jgi:predicted Fe-Mo cluster-binding NifX family protein
MKVAIAVEGNQVSEHFGRCSGFLLVTIEPAGHDRGRGDKVA